MSVAKVVELIADSPKSWEDATNEALQMASKTLIAHLDVKKPTTLPTTGGTIPQNAGVQSLLLLVLGASILGFGVWMRLAWNR